MTNHTGIGSIVIGDGKSEWLTLELQAGTVVEQDFELFRMGEGDYRATLKDGRKVTIPFRRVVLMIHADNSDGTPATLPSTTPGI